MDRENTEQLMDILGLDKIFYRQYVFWEYRIVVYFGTCYMWDFSRIIQIANVKICKLVLLRIVFCTKTVRKSASFCVKTWLFSTINPRFPFVGILSCWFVVGVANVVGFIENLHSLGLVRRKVLQYPVVAELRLYCGDHLSDSSLLLSFICLQIKQKHSRKL